MKKIIAVILVAMVLVAMVLGGCFNKNEIQTSASVEVPASSSSSSVPEVSSMPEASSMPVNPSDDLSSSEEEIPSSSSEESSAVEEVPSSSIPAVSISNPPAQSEVPAVSSEAPAVSSEAPVIVPTPVSTSFYPTKANYPIQDTAVRFVTTQEQKDQIYKWYDNVNSGAADCSYYYDVTKCGLSKYYSHAVVMQAVQAILDKGYNPAMYFGGGYGNAVTVIVGGGSPDGVTFSTSYLNAPIDWWAVLADSDLS